MKPGTKKLKKFTTISLDSELLSTLDSLRRAMSARIGLQLSWSDYFRLQLGVLAAAEKDKEGKTL